MLEKIYELNNRIGLIFHRLVMFCVYPSMVILLTADVILRYAFNKPISWNHDFNGLLLLIAFFGSLQQSWYEGKQMRMVILYSRLKGNWHITADIIALICGMFISGMLGYQCLKDIPGMIKTSETGMSLNIPFWPFSAFVAVFNIMVFVHLTMTCIRLITKTNKFKGA